MRSIPLLLALFLIGAGCATPPPAALPSEPPAVPPAEETMIKDADAATKEGDAMTTGDDAMAPKPDAMAKPPAPASNTNAAPPAAPAPAPFYISYTAAQYQKALADKRPVVLYFWASWCPICRADEPIIKQRIESSGLPVAGFRVDFDTQSDLKAQFRIPYQHTTVMLDANGNESARFTGPVDDATFAAALKKAAGSN